MFIGFQELCSGLYGHCLSNPPWEVWTILFYQQKEDTHSIMGSNLTKPRTK